MARVGFCYFHKKLFTKYITRLGKPDLTPDTKHLKRFFKCLAIEQKGLISDRLSIQTLCQYASTFETAYKRKHGVNIEGIVTTVRTVSLLLGLKNIY
jgi:hypothetical protein